VKRVLEPEVMVGEAESRAYASMDHDAPNQAFVSRLLELGASGHMLDIGTGPGDIPLLVCEGLPAARITAIDLSPAMLDQARERVAASDLGDRIHLARADAKHLDFPAEHFDAVFSNTVLHHLPDPLPFLRDARRVLRPGGALLIRDLFRPATRADADALVARYAAAASPEQQGLFFDSLCAAFTPDELRECAAVAGLATARVLVDSDRHVSIQIAAG
jgi:ubiquinone/menaquinone biosynthesis C-methylase UbiE